MLNISLDFGSWIELPNDPQHEPKIKSTAEAVAWGVHPVQKMQFTEYHLVIRRMIVKIIEPRICYEESFYNVICVSNEDQFQEVRIQ